MDIAQIVLLVGAANLAVLMAGAIVAVVRSMGRRRHVSRHRADHQTRQSAN
ncbi:MAG: hypothetical protein ACJ765_12050 [Chloroflexota bacterium]